MERLAVDVHLNEQGVLDSIADDVRRGLTARPKYLPPKYFYDERGSDLFERITELPEYYPTRTERALLDSRAGPLMAELRPQELVELGSGSSSKTRTLLDAGNGAHPPARYVPFDVSESMVRSTAAALLADYPALHIHGVIGDFERHLGELPEPLGDRLVLFLGSTIGNLTGPERHRFLAQVRRLLGHGGRLLMGVDLVKDVAVLEAAYNDSAGVTAEFNRNILRVVNKGLHANFHPEAFRHHAFYNREAARIEMHLVPESPQTVRLRDLELTIHVGPDESIWTESSHKFTRESTGAMLESAALRLERWYTDPEELFGLVLAAPA